MPILYVIIAVVLVLAWVALRGRTRRTGGLPVQSDAAPGPSPEGVKDPRRLALGILTAIAELDGPAGRDELDQIAIEAQLTFNVNRREAQEMTAFGLGLARGCGGGLPAVERLAAQLARNAGPEVAPDLLRMAGAAAAYAHPPDAAAEAAMERLRATFRVQV